MNVDIGGRAVIDFQAQKLEAAVLEPVQGMRVVSKRYLITILRLVSGLGISSTSRTSQI